MAYAGEIVLSFACKRNNFKPTVKNINSQKPTFNEERVAPGDVVNRLSADACSGEGVQQQSSDDGGNSELVQHLDQWNDYEWGGSAFFAE